MIARIAGIDIGLRGAVAILDGRSLSVFPLHKADRREVIYQLREIDLVLIEQSQLHPKSGKKTWKSMGREEGYWRGVCDSLNIQYDIVSPRTWMAHFKLKTGGDKTITERHMRKLFPMSEFNTETADSVAIAKYGQDAYEWHYTD